MACPSGVLGVRVRSIVRGVLRSLLAAAAAVFWLAAAHAGAWTMPQGTGQAILSFSSGAGDYDGQTEQDAQHEQRLETSLYLEYGLADWLTAVAQSGLEDYSISAPISNTYRGLDYSAAGLRARLFSSESFVWSVQGTALVPGAHDASQATQAGNTSFNTDWRTLVGSSFRLGSLSAFADASGGYPTRGGGPANEWRADLTLGVHLSKNLTVMAQSFNAFSYGPHLPCFSDEQTIVLQPSLVYDFDASWSAQIGVYATVRAIEASYENGVVVALWRRF